MGAPGNKMARHSDETTNHEVGVDNLEATQLEWHTKLLMRRVGSGERRNRQLRGQSCGIGMLLSCYADDLVFVQPDDATLKAGTEKCGQMN